MDWETGKREGTSGAGAGTFRHQPWLTLAPRHRHVSGYGVVACTNGAMVRPTGLLGAPAG